MCLGSGGDRAEQARPALREGRIHRAPHGACLFVTGHRRGQAAREHQKPADIAAARLCRSTCSPPSGNSFDGFQRPQTNLFAKPFPPSVWVPLCCSSTGRGVPDN